MSKKFLSDVLIECGLQVDGTTTLGTATATTVATSDNSTNIATTAWVKALGYSTTDSFISDVSLSGSTLSFTGINSAFTGSVDLSALSTQLTDIETVYASVRNVSGVLIPKGTPLATVIGQTLGNVSDVVPADASDPAFMPALFVADEDIAEEAEGRAVAYGEITGIDTSLYPSGTTVYVAPGGGWTDIKPTGTDLIQNLGVITKQHNTNGGGIVTGVGRSNDVPNIPQGYAWVGNANGVATPTLLGSLAYSSATYDNYGSWNLKTNGVQRTTVQSGGNLDIVAGTDISISYGAGGVVTINSTATGSIDYVSDVALNGNSLDFTGTGNAFAGSIDLSSLNAVSAIADLTDVDLTGLTNNAILKYDSVNQEWVVSTTNDTANATATAIVPFAIASVNTTSNGSGIGISWSNWNSSNSTLDFTFSTPQPNTDYIVITDTEVFDDFFVGVTNKSVNGFRAEFYDSSQSRTPSTFSEFNFIVYASDPTQQIKSSVGGINELSDVDTVTSAPSNGEALVWDGTNWVPGTISTTNNYLTGLSFNTGNGVLTATRQGLSDLTVDLDGRYLTSYTETDPVFLASVAAGITAQDLNNWNDAYNWGDHSAAGYLTSFSETDTLATVTSRGATTSTAVTFQSNVTLGNSADLVFSDTSGTFPTSGKGFDWTLNNDGARIYAIQPSSDAIDFVFQLRDNATTNDRFVFHVKEWQGAAYDKYPLIIRAGTQFDLVDSALYTNGTLRLSNTGVLSNVSGNISMFTNDAGYLTSFTETDPIFSAHVSAGITGTQISNWDTAHSWGDHGSAGYLTSETVTSLSLSANVLRYTDENGANTDLDLALYLDDTNLARLVSGTLNGSTGIATFTRDDSSTFTVDFSAFLADGNNYVDSLAFSTSTGVLTLGRNGSLSDLTVDLDGRYLTSYTETDTLASVTTRGNTTSNSISVGDFQANHQSAENATTKAEMLSMAVAKFKPHSTNSGTLAIAQVDDGNSVGLQFTNGAGTADWDIALQPFGGNVGIGTPSPQDKLHVKGAVRVDHNDTDGTVYYTGYGVEFARGTSYLRPSVDGAYTLNIGAADDNLDWNTINIKTSNLFKVRSSGADRFQIGSDVNILGATDFTIAGSNRRFSFTSGTGTIRTTNATSLYLQTNSTTAITIDSSQNVGVGVAPAYKLDVAGDVRITGSHSVITSAERTPGDPAAVVLEAIDTADYYGAFIDYVIHDGSRDSQRAGTLTVTWNQVEIRFSETATMDIGDTTVATLDAVINGSNADIRFTAPDPTWEIKYTLRLL